MPPKRRAAAVFVHGLAKKPPLEKLKEIWLWGLSIGNPRPDVFPDSKVGINLVDDGVPHFFNYYADVFYADDYETDFQSYYESDQQLEKADGVAKLWLSPPRFAYAEGLNPAEARRVLELVATHEDDFLGRWHEHFGR